MTNDYEMLREVAKEIGVGAFAEQGPDIEVFLCCDLAKRLAVMFPTETGHIGQLLRGDASE